MSRQNRSLWPSRGNIDGDLTVATDFPGLLGACGSDPGGPPDFDGDCTVGISDFVMLLAGWEPCSKQATVRKRHQ